MAKYVFLGVFLFFGLPYLTRDQPGATGVRVTGAVSSYTATTTMLEGPPQREVTRYAPMIAYEDASGQKYQTGVNAFSDRQPFMLGEEVDIYYKAQDPTVIMLVDDPYRAWMDIFFRAAAIPLFAMVVALFLLRRRASSLAVDALTLFAPIFLPFIMLGVATITVGISDVPQSVSYHTTSETWSSDSTFMTIGMMAVALIAFALVAEWPLRIIRALIVALRGGFKPQTPIAEVAAKAVPKK